MYFNAKNNYFHGIMFHHFHDDVIHKRGQGSISKDQFYKLIRFIGQENILDAEVFFDKLSNNKIKQNEVCFTFDDAIKCQLDIALPVLEDLKIKSYFFVYTSIFDGRPDYLEIFRYFRMNYFDSVDDFYSIFFDTLDYDIENFLDGKKSLIETIKERYNFYSYEDIKFRIVRDYLLGKDNYEKCMFKIMDSMKFNYNKIISKLFFEKDDVVMLDNLGHKIGLHTHNHPTKIEKMNYDQQNLEYTQNKDDLAKILNKPKDYINTSSHPLGSYNKDSLEILTNLGIKLAFKDNMRIEREKGMKKINNSSLEIAREDHIEIFNKM